jgi:hypothetical protein
MGDKTGSAATQGADFGAKAKARATRLLFALSLKGRQISGVK